MAKFLANVVVMEETSLPALFYYRHLLEERIGNPVYYYDEIDKSGIDAGFSAITHDEIKFSQLELVKDKIDEVTKTVYHGFKYTVVHENVKDEGTAKKQAQSIQKMIKEHKAPYNDIFKRYIVSIIQG